MGFIFYDTTDFAPMQDFLVSFGADYSNIVAAAHNAMISALNPNKVFNPADFDFCTLSNGRSCSILVYNVFDVNRGVSPFNFQLSQIACHNSFTTPNWKELVYPPPFPLVEKYYECTNTESDAFQNALGIAVGNSSFWVPLILLASLPLVYIFLNYYRDAPSTKLEYGDDEMEEAARHIGLILLRVRDGYFQTYDGKLVEHCLAIMAALKAAPALATETQRRKAEVSGERKKNRSTTFDNKDDSDAEIDPIDDIA